MSIARYFRPALKALFNTDLEPLWLRKHPRRQYIVNYVNATPRWVNESDMQKLRQCAKTLSETTGTPHVLDHIIPLSHPYVCGLNVPWNIQILTAAQNATKSNRWCPNQMDLF